jgi:succinyl-CoA synthetase beta subunit
MNIHEYQGKAILKSFGVRVQEGIVADTAEQAVDAAKKLKVDYNSDWVVIKAQIHAGGRGKGGGVKLAKNLEEVKEKAGQIIGMQLVTPQTGPEGKLVSKVLVAQDVYYPGESETKEFYISVLLDRSKRYVTLLCTLPKEVWILKRLQNILLILFSKKKLILKLVFRDFRHVKLPSI